MPLPLLSYISEIANLYARVGVEAAFNKCERTSALLQDDLQRRGIVARRIRGTFRPTTPETTWHPRWVKLGGSPYIHYWVQAGGHIIDPTAAQFGGPDLLIVPVGDERFEILEDVTFSLRPYEVGTKRFAGMVCAMCAHDGFAVTVTHAARRVDGATVYYCLEHANQYAEFGARVRPAWRPPKP